MKKLMYIAAAALIGLTACTDDYKDWTPQTQPTQPATVAFGDGSVTIVPTIDLNAIDEGQTLVKVADITAPTASDEAYAPTYTLNIGDATYAIDADGQMAVADLQQIIADQFGRRPVARTISATISAWLTNGATAVKTATSEAFNITAIPEAPAVEAKYYLTGSINNWDNTNTDYCLTNDGSDPYENPTYTLRIPAPESGNVEFKLTPASGLGGDWSGCLAAGAEAGKFVYNNGGGNLVIEAVEGAKFYDLTFNMLDQTWTVKAQLINIEPAYYLTGSINGWNNSDTTYCLTNDGTDPYANPTFKLRIPAPEDGGNIEFKMTPQSGLGGDWSGCLAAGDAAGTFVYNNGGGNLVIEAVEGALFYDLTFNMMELTWTVQAISFADYIYEIGNESGWGTSHPLAKVSEDGKYMGFAYLNGEYKFKPNADNWEGDWEKVSGTAYEGTIDVNGASNVDAADAAFYQINVDLGAMTYKLVKIESISIIGSVKGAWDTDVDLTYDATAGCWTATAELNAGEWKFRANHNWDINWGGDAAAMTQNGANLQLSEAGTYTFKFYPICNGKSYVEVTKQ